MKKFFKKILSAITAAAIMTGACVFNAFADGHESVIRIPEEVEVVLSGMGENGADLPIADAGLDVISAENLSGMILKVSLKEANKSTHDLTVTAGTDKNGNETVTAEEDGSFTVNVPMRRNIAALNMMPDSYTITIAVELKEEPAPAPVKPVDVNSDGIVWVGGKDIKASKDGKTPAVLYKTESMQVIGTYAGGKWNVAVTEADIDTVAKFIAKFDGKGKLDKNYAKACKAYATAKIKNGVITITAGKKAGAVRVWLYEVKDKKIVTTVDSEKAPVAAVGNIDPVSYAFTVKMGNPKIILSEKTAITNKETDVVKNFEMIPGTSSKTYNIITDKTIKDGNNVVAAVPDKDAEYIVKFLNGKNEVEKITANLSEGKITVTVAADYVFLNAKKDKGDKISMVITNVQTSKSTKITVIVKEAAAKTAAIEALKAAIAAAEPLNEADYSVGWADFAAALAAAKEIDTETAEVSAITGAAVALTTAQAALRTPREVAVAALNDVIAQAEEIIESGRGSDSLRNNISEKLTAAKELNKETAAVEDINTLTEQLAELISYCPAA